MKQYISAQIRLGRYLSPTGAVLLYNPCLWGTLIGANSFDLQTLKYGIVFGIGAYTMRAAGCVVNDMWDRDIDKNVERTKLRPLASGELSLKDAFINLFINCSCGLGVLTFLNWPAIVASFAIVPLAALYPLAKRYFKYPQFVLAITFNFGVFVAGLQLAGTITPALAIMYLAGIVHTIIYDTIYAHQDKKFDQQLGLYSTAYTLPKELPYQLTFIYTGLIGLALFLSSAHPLSYAALGILQTSQIAKNKHLRMDDPSNCQDYFKFQANVQWFTSLTLLLGLAFK
ncbi:hypothetical protein pb186bvf_001349 [Paramecium bursaria]